MRNINLINENRNKNVINIKSELLFREAEDDFYYFNKPLKALKKLKIALNLTPTHLKSLVFAGDICFCRGNIKKALGYYAQACNSGITGKLLASVGNCYKTLGENEKAVYYFNKALMCGDFQNEEQIFQILEMKAESAISAKLYTEAKDALQSLKTYADSKNLPDFAADDFYFLYNKLKIRKKIQTCELRVI